jgi:hypothetical protein
MFRTEFGIMALLDLIRRAPRGVFMAATQQTVSEVQAKLAAAIAAVAPIEAKLLEVSLASAVSDDMKPAIRATAALAEARARVEVLRHAVVAAEAAERERVAAARVKANAAAHRAMRQHLGALQRASDAHEQALAVEDQTFRAILAAAASCRKLLPTYRPNDDPYVGLFEGPLARLCSQERRRVGYRNPMVTQEVALYDTSAGPDHDWWKAPSLSAEIASVITWVQSKFGETIGMADPTLGHGTAAPKPAAPRPPYDVVTYIDPASGVRMTKNVPWPDGPAPASSAPSPYRPAEIVGTPVAPVEGDPDPRPILRRQDVQNYYEPATGELKQRTVEIEYRADTSGEAALQTPEFLQALADMKGRGRTRPAPDPVIDEPADPAPEPAPAPTTFAEAFAAEQVAKAQAELSANQDLAPAPVPAVEADASAAAATAEEPAGVREDPAPDAPHSPVEARTEAEGPDHAPRHPDQRGDAPPAPGETY